MESESIIQYVKAHRWLYMIYYRFMSAVVNFIRLFVKPDDRLILFVVFGGKYYSDSPRCIYEAMLCDNRFSSYRLVWAFRSPNKFPNIPSRVKIDTLQYFVTALKARCWITNESITRALNFKGIRTYYFNTTHTALPKISGPDLKKGATFHSAGTPKADCYCAQSEAEKRIQLRKFELSENQVAVIGYPKNDRISLHSREEELNIRKKLGISPEKVIVLYAPTFREDYIDNPPQSLPIHLNHWAEVLGDDFFILYRAHHLMSLPLNSECSNILDVSSYPDNTELLITADVLVSDYSGIFFEFGVQDKPMFCYAYDYEQYVTRRGLYVNVKDELPGGGMDEDDFLELLKFPFSPDILEKVRQFKKKWINVYGDATSRSLDIIYKNINSV